MSKMRASYYARYQDVIVSATGGGFPDALDEMRVAVMRGFAEALALTADYVYDDDADSEAAPDPGTVDTTNLPPID